MIIYPQSFIVSPPDSQPLSYPRFGYQTFTLDRSATNVTVSSETADGPRDAPLRPDTTEAWIPSALPATWELDLGASRDIDYIGVVGNFGTKQTTVTPAWSPDLVTAYATWGVGSMLPSDDTPIVFMDVLRSVRRIRLSLAGASIPSMAIVYAGKVLSMQRGIKVGWKPLNYSRETVLMQSLSRGGQFLGQSFRRMGVKSDPEFDFLEQSWYRTNFDPFVKAARLYPYFFIWNALDFPLEVGFVWTNVDIVPTYSSSRYLSVTVPMRGVGNV